MAEEAEFNSPLGITPSESDGSLLVVDGGSYKIRTIVFQGMYVHALLLAI